jgi:hypothetical protein
VQNSLLHFLTVDLKPLAFRILLSGWKIFLSILRLRSISVIKFYLREFWNRNLAERVLFDQCSTADNERRLLLTVKSRIGVDVTISVGEDA